LSWRKIWINIILKNNAKTERQRRENIGKKKEDLKYYENKKKMN